MDFVPASHCSDSSKEWLAFSQLKLGSAKKRQRSLEK